VARWVRAAGVRPVVLRWQGSRPTADIQAAARKARYGLLTQWCRARGVLHLLLAHHREDQAETLLLRLGRGSGLDGLAAMPAIGEQDGVRLLRPLLGVPKARLQASLQEMGQPWIDDPSNRNPAYARVRWRALLPTLADEGLTASRLAATAQRLGHARVALDTATTALLAEAATLHPQGYLTLVIAPLDRAPRETALRGLARCLLTIGDANYTPRLERLERMHDSLLSGGATEHTLAGCRILRQGERLLICREPSRADTREPAVSGATARWDERFELTVAERRLPSGTTIARLGTEGWTQVVRAAPEARRHHVPGPARYSLPALWHEDTVLEVPHLDWRAGNRAGSLFRAISFSPRHPLSSASWQP
jgi:tRNA(Ile)-lysidine synthase